MESIKICYVNKLVLLLRNCFLLCLKLSVRDIKDFKNM